MTDDELRRRLRAAAHTHRPDRERMLARVERGMAEGRPPPRRPRRPVWSSWLRVVSATVAVAGVCAVGAYAVASVVRDGDPRPQSVATSRTPHVTPEATPDGTHGTDGTDGTERLLETDGVIDPGSNAYWSQSNITVTAKKPLASLTVELRVVQTGKVADTGNWRSLPVEDFDVSVRERGGALVYRWTLKDGRTVPAGRHVFAGQYDHGEGPREAGGDAYTATATTTARAGASGERDERRGDFSSAG